MARDSRELAEELTESPPVLDDVRRARMERALLEGADAPMVEADEVRSRRPFVAGVAVGLAVAAAAVLFWWSAHEPAMTEGDAVASFEALRDGVLVRRGIFAQGEAVETTDAQLVRVALHPGNDANTEPRALVTVEPSSRAVFEQVEGADLAVRLDRGRVRVEFHPVVRGEESFVVHTEAARVEVVGTVFEVSVDEQHATFVSVTEGVVRVVPVHGDTVLVHAGESVSVQSRSMQSRAERPSERVITASAERPIEAEESVAQRVAVEDETTPVVEADEASEVAPVRVAPDAPSLAEDARFDLAARYFDQGRFVNARHELYAIARSSRSTANRTRAWVEVAETFERQSDAAQGAEAYRRAAAIGRGTVAGANAFFALGRLRASLGEAAAARAAYQRYLDDAPAGPLAERARRALCRLGERIHCDLPPSVAPLDGIDP